MRLFPPPTPQRLPKAPSHVSLDVVVPFTTPELTLAALRAADRLGDGLHIATRLLRIQVVPYPLDLQEPPVPASFAKQQLAALYLAAAQDSRGAFAIQYEIINARNFLPALRSALTQHSLVILATRRRPWRTCTERLAGALRDAGHTVLLVRKNAEKEIACLT